MLLRSLSALLIVLVSLHAYAQPNTREILEGRGIWLQDPSNFKIERIAQLKQLGVRRVHIMASDDPRVQGCPASQPYLRVATHRKLADLVKAFKVSGIHVIGTLYVLPSRDDLQRLFAPEATELSGVARTLIVAGVDGLELDLEGTWANSAPCGFDTHKEAFTYVQNLARQISPGLPIGVTTHLGRATDPKSAIAGADWLAIQAYSTHCWEGKCVAFNDRRFGPGARQRQVAEKIKSTTVPVIVGLPLHAQRFHCQPSDPGPCRKPEEAMGAALDAWQELARSRPNFLGHSYWSTSWVFKEALEEERKFLRLSASK